MKRMIEQDPLLIYNASVKFISLFCAPGVTDASSCVEGAGNDSSTSTTMLSNVECFNEFSNTQSETEQTKITPQSDNITCECNKEAEKLHCEQRTGQLVKEVRLCLSMCM